MANNVRNWLFRLIFSAGTVAIVLVTPLAALFGRGALTACVIAWGRFQRWALASLLDIRIRVEGTRASGQVLYAAKHQAMLETLELPLVLGTPAIVMKRELGRIPIWGWAARRYGTIMVDRAASASALRAMVHEANAAAATGRSILIFPEGTRVAPGETPPLQAGFAGLYRALGLPVVPIALDSGKVSPRHGPKRPGVVTIRIGETIPGALPRREVEARVHAAINALEHPGPTSA